MKTLSIITEQRIDPKIPTDEDNKFISFAKKPPKMMITSQQREDVPILT